MGKGSLKLKQDRRDRLLGLLRSDSFWTTSGLANELEISQRTLMRDISELKEAGYPIETDRGRGGGIRLQGRWGVDKLNLSSGEAITLLLSLAVMESISPASYGLGVRSLRQKIANVFPESQQKTIISLRKRIFIGDPASEKVQSSFSAVDESVFEEIKIAFFNSKRLKFIYKDEKGKKTAREADPQFLLLNWPVWYLLAWDYLRRDVRVFRIDRIKKPQVLTNSITYRAKNIFIKSIEEYFSSL